MHGLINRSFENFMRNTYGDAVWLEVMRDIDADIETFEPMFTYDDAVLQRITETSANALYKPRDVLLEDWGTYLVAHPASERVRRLLRFGGVDYEDFLLSLEELPGRTRLAVSDLVLPRLELSDLGESEYRLDCHCETPGYGHVLLGLLRALADDYGALVLLEFVSRDDGAESLSIRLLETAFSEGRDFALAQQGAA